MNLSALANCYTTCTRCTLITRIRMLHFLNGNKVKSSMPNSSYNSTLVAASYYVALQIAKQKKPHTIGETLIKSCASKMVELVLGDESRKKLDTIPLSDNTIARRIRNMAQDIRAQLILELNSSTHGLFSIQLDESTDVSNFSQLMVFVRWATIDGLQEEILYCSPLETTTRAADVLGNVDSFFKKHELKWQNLCSVCTDGAPAMIGARSGFAKLVRDLAPEATSVHCMIHRQALASRTLPMDMLSTLTAVIQMVNYVKRSALNTRLFSQFCREMSADHTTLLYYTNVRWLSKGNMLDRVFEMRAELREFFQEQGQLEFAAYFTDLCFVQHLAYLADIFEKLNQLNLSMQGKQTTILNLSDSINSFLQKIVIWKSNAEKSVFAMFERLSLLGDGISIGLGIIEHLAKLMEEFQHYFPDRKDMNLDLVRNPFHTKPETLPLELQDEFIDLINYSTFKTLFEKEELVTAWCNISSSYPRISKYVLKMLLSFPTTYLCESAFSTLVTIKSKARNRLNVEDDIVCSISKIQPRISLLSQEVQCQGSH